MILGLLTEGLPCDSGGGFTTYDRLAGFGKVGGGGKKNAPGGGEERIPPTFFVYAKNI